MGEGKPKVYVISWIDHDEYEPYLLLCGREVGKEEFRKICNAAVVEAVERLLAALPDKDRIPFRYVVSLAAKILVEERGFVRPEELHASYWEEDFAKVLPAELMQRLLEHNERASSLPADYCEEVVGRAVEKGTLRRIE
jgi:hypothetical protein